VISKWLRTPSTVLLLASILAQPARLVTEAWRFSPSSMRVLEKPVSRPLVRLRGLPSVSQHLRVRMLLEHAIHHADRAQPLLLASLPTPAWDGPGAVSDPVKPVSRDPLRC
jgi:hypothetical protein